MSQSMRFERSHEIVIDAPAGDILDYVSNPNSWPEWIAASHHIDSAPGRGSAKLLEEAGNALKRLKAQDLPIALPDSRATSGKLRNVGEQIDSTGNLRMMLLTVGLSLAGWRFFNGPGTLMPADALTAAPGRRASAGADL